MDTDLDTLATALYVRVCAPSHPLLTAPRGRAETHPRRPPHPPSTPTPIPQARHRPDETRRRLASHPHRRRPPPQPPMTRRWIHAQSS